MTASNRVKPCEAEEQLKFSEGYKASHPDLDLIEVRVQNKGKHTSFPVEYLNQRHG